MSEKNKDETNEVETIEKLMNELTDEEFLDFFRVAKEARRKRTTELNNSNREILQVGMIVKYSPADEYFKIIKKNRTRAICVEIIFDDEEKTYYDTNQGYRIYYKDIEKYDIPPEYKDRDQIEELAKFSVSSSQAESSDRNNEKEDKVLDVNALVQYTGREKKYRNQDFKLLKKTGKMATVALVSSPKETKRFNLSNLSPSPKKVNNNASCSLNEEDSDEDIDDEDTDDDEWGTTLYETVRFSKRGGKIKGYYLSTYGGGPEGGYVISDDKNVYTCHRDWGIPWNISPCLCEEIWIKIEDGCYKIKTFYSPYTPPEDDEDATYHQIYPQDGLRELLGVENTDDDKEEDDDDNEDIVKGVISCSLNEENGGGRGGNSGETSSLTNNQKASNEIFILNKLENLSEDGLWLYPQIGECFTKKNGKFCGSKSAIQQLKNITRSSFWNNFVETD